MMQLITLLVICIGLLESFNQTYCKTDNKSEYNNSETIERGISKNDNENEKNASFKEQILILNEQLKQATLKAEKNKLAYEDAIKSMSDRYRDDIEKLKNDALNTNRDTDRYQDSSYKNKDYTSNYHVISLHAVKGLCYNIYDIYKTVIQAIIKAVPNQISFIFSCENFGLCHHLLRAVKYVKDIFNDVSNTQIGRVLMANITLLYVKARYIIESLFLQLGLSIYALLYLRNRQMDQFIAYLSHINPRMSLIIPNSLEDRLVLFIALLYGICLISKIIRGILRMCVYPLRLCGSSKRKTNTVKSKRSFAPAKAK